MAQQPKLDPDAEAQSRLASAWKLEAALVFLVIAIGIALRLACPSRMAVEHFDEGVYSSNRWFSEQDGFHYPKQYLYAPPLLPWLIEWSFVLFGPSNFAAMLPSLIAGCLAMPLVWWLIRTWFTPRAALSGLILVAGSSLHITFSRAALTDALLLFWLVAAVGAGAQGLSTRSWKLMVIAGLFTGLAWWTKYNGWLPLAILGSGGVAWALLPGRPLTLAINLPEHQTAPVTPAPISTESRWRRLAIVVALWSVMAATAIAIWAPWLWSLQSHGGYAAVAANHRGYFVGWSGWLDSFWQQNINLWAFNGWSSIVSMGLATLLPSILPARSLEGFTWNTPELLLRLGIASLLTCLMLLPGSVLFLVAGVEVLLWTVLSQKGRILTWSPKFSLGIWLLAAWWSGMLLATPMYTPYARLLLPVWLAGLVIVSLSPSRLAAYSAMAVALLRGTLPPRFQAMNQEFARSRRGRVGLKIWMGIVWLAGLLCLGCLLAAPWYQDIPWNPGWESRTTCSTISREVIADILNDLQLPAQGDRDRFAVYSYGEPALLFQLRLADVPLVAPVQDLRFAKPDAEPPRIPSYVLLGPQAFRTQGFPAQFQEAHRRLRLVKSYELENSRLVVSDAVADHAKLFWLPSRELPSSYKTVLLYRVLDQPAVPVGPELAEFESPRFVHPPFHVKRGNRS